MKIDCSADSTNQGHISGSIIFNSYVHFLNLKQKNHITNQNGKTLDCVMTNDNVEIISLNHSSKSLVPKIDYHHSPLDIFLKFTNWNFNPTSEYPIMHNFNKCNFNEISNFISDIDFESNLNNTFFSMEEIVTTFYEIIHHTFTLFVPKTKIFNNYSPVYGLMLTLDILLLKKISSQKI